MRNPLRERSFGMPRWSLLALLLVACCGKPKVSDTGYAGTWVRGNERIRSSLAIVPDGTSWRTRIGVKSADGTYTLASDWDGAGQELLNGAKVHDLVFRTSMDPATGHLRIECTGTGIEPSHTPLRYVDELVVEAGGLTLSAYTVERDGTRFEGASRPRREFQKASDEVEDPPSAARGR
jgi:hypothetical protein